MNLRFMMGKKISFLATYTLIISSIILNFFQYWLLTGIFPFGIILFLLLACFVAEGLMALLASFSGTHLKEKKEKINILVATFSVQQSRFFGIMSLIQSILFLALQVAILWMFWKYAFWDYTAAIYIALLQFSLGYMLDAVFGAIMAWPALTHEYYDDDVRNHLLISNFAKLLIRTFMLLIPFWLFKEDAFAVLQNIGINVSAFWILTMIPIALFILCYLVPFFIGVKNYRNQFHAIMDWRKQWLGEYSTIALLPESPVRDEKLANKISNLVNEIDRRRKENKLFDLYVTAIFPYNYHNPPNQDYIDFDEKPSSEPSSAIVPARQPNGPQELMKFFKYQQNLKSTYTGNNLDHELLDFIQSNSQRVSEWDLRFQNLNFLLGLYQTSVNFKPTDVKDYIQHELNNTDKQTAAPTVKRNIMAGAFVTSISVAIVWVFNIFEKDISTFIRSLVG